MKYEIIGPGLSRLSGPAVANVGDSNLTVERGREKHDHLTTRRPSRSAISLQVNPFIINKTETGGSKTDLFSPSAPATPSQCESSHLRRGTSSRPSNQLAKALLHLDSAVNFPIHANHSPIT